VHQRNLTDDQSHRDLRAAHRITRRRVDRRESVVLLYIAGRNPQAHDVLVEPTTTWRQGREIATGVSPNAQRMTALDAPRTSGCMRCFRQLKAFMRHEPKETGSGLMDLPFRLVR